MKKAFIVSIFLFILAGCEDTYVQRIPYAPVYLKIDLTTSRDRGLAGVGGGKFYSTSDKVYQSERMGVSGVYVYHSFSDTYVAFDQCCPYEGRREIKVTRVGEGKLKCSTCGSVFDVTYGTGAAVSGPANEKNFSLQQYPVRVLNERELEVRN